MAAIQEGGIPCTRMKIFEEASTEDFETGYCRVTRDQIYEVDIYLFSTTDGAEDGLARLRSVYDGEILSGPNWYLTTGNPALTRDIAEIVGGEVVEAPPTPS